MLQHDVMGLYFNGDAAKDDFLTSVSFSYGDDPMTWTQHTEVNP